MAELQHYLLKIDYSLLELINNHGSFSLGDQFFPFITDLHKQLYFQLIAYPLILLLYYVKLKRRGIVLFFGLILMLGLNDFIGGQLVKKSFQRPRPFQNEELHVQQRSSAGGYSFYSNHASNTTAFATYAAMTLSPLALVAVPAAILVSYSRVYNGVHYPSDVLGGALMGFFVAYLFASLIQKLKIARGARK